MFAFNSATKRNILILPESIYRVIKNNFTRFEGGVIGSKKDKININIFIIDIFPPLSRRIRRLYVTPQYNPYLTSSHIYRHM